MNKIYGAPALVLHGTLSSVTLASCAKKIGGTGDGALDNPARCKSTRD